MFPLFPCYSFSIHCQIMANQLKNRCNSRRWDVYQDELIDWRCKPAWWKKWERRVWEDEIIASGVFIVWSKCIQIFYITKYHNIYTENVWFVTISRSLIKKRICDIGCGNGYGIEISWIMVTWSSGFAQTFAQSCWNSWHETEMGFSSLLWCVYICEWNGLWNERKCWPITNWLDFWIVWELLVAGGRNYCPALMPHASGEVYV